ncbi:MAG TPA: hypothetical protein VNA29_09815 [Sphingomicrobium sp.]|nr:hypothetical protein [Sphingomicrobium sp.]
MRQVILATAILLGACQLENGDNAILNSTTEAENGSVASKVAKAAGRPVSNPDAPVSSDDPPLPAPDDDRPSTDCPITSSSGWHAHVNAMPGPNDNPRLIVSGKVTVPTGGYKLSLRMGAVAESYPVQVTVDLDAIPPSGMATQALETRDLRGSWRSEERVGSVTVRCGSRVVARLSNIETAR